MAKWYGIIAYGIQTQTRPGVWKADIVKKSTYGDVVDERWRRQAVNKVNDDITLSTTISIIADQFASNHCSEIIYVEYMGTKWTVSEIRPEYPRLYLTLGGVYNGEDA